MFDFAIVCHGGRVVMIPAFRQKQKNTKKRHNIPDIGFESYYTSQDLRSPEASPWTAVTEVYS